MFAPKGQIVIGQAMSGGLEDSRSSTGGVYLREDMGLLGAIFDFHILRETLVHLKTVVS